MAYKNLNVDHIQRMGSDDDAVYLAPLGTELPKNLADLEAPWVDMGWLHEDGLEIKPSDSVDKLKAHQGHRVYRTVMTDSSTDLGFKMLESAMKTLKIQWDVKSSKTESGSIHIHVLGNGRKISTYALVVEMKSEKYTYRYCCPRFSIGERGTLAFKSTEDTVYDVNGTFEADITLLTNDPAYAPA